MDRQDTIRMLELTHSDSGVIEIVADANRGRQAHSVAEAVELAHTIKAKAVYFVVNPIDEELLDDYLTKKKGSGESARTCDEHISYRRWVLFDFDPVRPAGVCSSDEEKALAAEIRDEVMVHLRGHEWPEPATIVDSGNGYHLYYACDIPNDHGIGAMRSLFRRLLQRLDHDFGGDEVNVDRTVFKAGQIMRMPGTMNKKGKATELRPHRPVKLIQFETEPDLVTLEQVEEVAGPAPQRSETAATVEQLDVYAYLDEAGIGVRREIEREGYLAYEIDECPFDAGHNRGEVVVTQGDDGALGFCCKHHSCADFGWTEFKEKVGTPSPEHWIGPSAEDDFGAIETTDDSEQSFLEIFQEERKKKVRMPEIRWIADITEEDIVLREPVVDGLFRVGDVVNIIAAAKTNKSWLALGLAYAIAQGEPWMGFDTTQGNVLVIDNELTKSDLNFRSVQVRNKLGLDLKKMIGEIGFDNFRGNLEPLDSMVRYFEALKNLGIKLVILDALYRLIPKGCSENDNADMTRIYNTLATYAEAAGVAIAVIHHASKGDQSSKSTTDVGSGAGAISRAADCHITLRPHDTEGLAVLDAAVRTFQPVEQFSVSWEWPVWTKSEEAPKLLLPASRNEDKKARDNEAATDDLIQSLKEKGVPMTASEMQTSFGMGSPRVTKLMNAAAKTGEIVIGTTINKQNNEVATYAAVTSVEYDGIDDLFGNMEGEA